MSSPRRFEGPDLEALLAQVRTEVGTAATIVEANKLRRGGLAGFFAKESFEVVVDLPDDDPTPSAALAVPESTDATEDDDTFEPLSLLELAERVSDGESRSAGVGFETVLEEALATDWPAEAAIAAAEPMARSTPQPRIARGPLTAARAAAPMPAPEAPPTSTPAPVLPSMDAPRATRGAPSTVLSVPTAGERSRTVDRYALGRIGLPESMVAMARGGDSSAVELLRLLERLPAVAALPSGRGAVIAVVGGRDDALELAEALAEDLGTDPDAIVLASRSYRGRTIPTSRRLVDAGDADTAQRSWRRRARPTLVAIEAPLPHSNKDGCWARSVLDALEPAMVWGSVDAARKPEDIDCWAHDLGGLDALAVTALDTTSSPAAVLRCGIPVGRVEGSPATPALWAALLTERLAA